MNAVLKPRVKLTLDGSYHTLKDGAVTLEPTEPFDGWSADKLAAKYIEFRDARAELKRRYETKDFLLKEGMEEIERKLLSLCNEANASSIKTQHGTIIRSVETNYNTSDWDSFYNFVIDNKAPYLLFKRINKTAMGEFLEAHPDQHPKGLNMSQEYKVSVRKPSR